MQTTTHILLDGWLGGGRMMGMGRGFFFPGGIFALVATLALLLLLFWAFRAWSGNRQTPALAGAGAMNLASGKTPLSTPTATPMTATTPLAVIQMRYAKGELSRAEYETMREDLQRDWPAEGVAATESTSTPDTEEIESAVANEKESESEGESETRNQAEVQEEPKNPAA